MSEELEELEPLFDIDQETGEVKRADVGEPDAALAHSIRGSASLIKAYQSCPAQAYGRITRQKGTKTMALVNGIAVHEALEAYVKYDKDAQVAYMDTIKYEAEKNAVSLNGPKALEAMKVGKDCVGAGLAILAKTDSNGYPLKDRIDKDLIEAGWTFNFNGFVYVGKIDFMYFKRPEIYTIADWKSGKNAPDPYELNNDIQFTLYAKGASEDPKLKTFGLWPKWNVYIHLRGASAEFDKDGKRVAKNRTKKPLQYDFVTERTTDFVADAMMTVIDPEMQNMQNGVWGRRPGKACSFCGYFNKEKKRCEVEIPRDSVTKPQLSLIDDKMLTASMSAKLRPYNDVTSK